MDAFFYLNVLDGVDEQSSIECMANGFRFLPGDHVGIVNIEHEPMVVVAYETGNLVTCRWRDTNNQLCEHKFPEFILKKLESGGYEIVR